MSRSFNSGHTVPGRSAGHAAKARPVSSTTKRVLIAAGVAAYLGATAAATVYGSAALYMLFHKQRPAGITAGTMSAFWFEYSADPKERKKLQLALMLPPLVLLVLVPMGIVAATQKRRELRYPWAPATAARRAGPSGPAGASCALSDRPTGLTHKRTRRPTWCRP